VVNLASDIPGLAQTTDSNLVNPWGIASSPTGPFWFGNEGRGNSAILDGSGEDFSLVVSISAAGWGSAPTGVVFNSGPGFVISENGISAPSRFLFASENGVISAWSAVVDSARAIPAIDNSSSWAFYTGLAIAANTGGHSFLYAADFSHGTVDVFDQNFRPVLSAGGFRDPTLPTGFAPFNVASLNGLLFVAYAQHGVGGSEMIDGPGHGFIDAYDMRGNLVRRFASGGPLDSPWGLALAPNDFGAFGGALLIGNNGDGHVSAYDPKSGTFLGQLRNDAGLPLVIPDLWALSFGNGHVGGDAHTLFFTAGIGDEQHGLFGAIQAPNRRGADTAGSGIFDPRAPGEPGDYPLPPRSGPTLRGTERAIPISQLLPMKDSSLVMIPTLFTASMQDGAIQNSSSSSSVSVSAVRAAIESGSGAGLSPSTAEDAILPKSIASEPLALYAFLDLSAATFLVPSSARVQAWNGDEETLSPRLSLIEGSRAAIDSGTLADQPLEATVSVGIPIAWWSRPVNWTVIVGGFLVGLSTPFFYVEFHGRKSSPGEDAYPGKKSRDKSNG
jgi:uncharacterized protein (TIGR03118 family)